MLFSVIAHRGSLAAVAGLLLVIGAVALGPSCGSSDTSLPPPADADSGSDRTVLPESSVPVDSTTPQDSPEEALTNGDANNDVVAPDPWILDPTAWKPVEGADFSLCEISEAIPEKIQFPPLPWASCGAGCESADLGKGYLQNMGSFGVASTAQPSATPNAYLTYELFFQVASKQFLHLVRAVRLDDGVTIGVLKANYKIAGNYSPCGWGRLRETAFVNELGGSIPTGNTATHKDLLATAPFEVGSWTWARPALLTKQQPGVLDAFDTEDHRRRFGVGKGTVYVWHDPSSSEATILESNSLSHFGAGQGDLAIWTDYGGGTNARIRGWRPDGGVRTIVDGLAQDTCALTLSPSSLVGMMGSSTFYQCSWGWTEGRFWATPRAYSPAEVKLSISPPVPGGPMFCRRLKTWGDFAACATVPWVTQEDGQIIQTEWPRDYYLLLAELSTWKMWRLDQRKGFLFSWDAMTLTPTHLYVGERPDAIPSDPLTLQSMYRFDLSQIDKWAKPVLTP